MSLSFWNNVRLDSEGWYAMICCTSDLHMLIHGSLKYDPCVVLKMDIKILNTLGFTSSLPYYMQSQHANMVFGLYTVYWNNWRFSALDATISGKVWNVSMFMANDHPDFNDRLLRREVEEALLNIPNFGNDKTLCKTNSNILQCWNQENEALCKIQYGCQQSPYTEIFWFKGVISSESNFAFNHI